MLDPRLEACQSTALSRSVRIVYSMEDSDLEGSRSPKRRRVNGNDANPRYSSPDELAASSDHEASYSHQYHSRNTSNPKRDSGDQHPRRSYDDSGSEGSPDELDHTIHTFYRGESWNRSQRQSRDKSASEERSIETPRTATPPRRKPEYVRYKQKMVLKGHRRGVAAVRFSPDGRMIASCCKFEFLSRDQVSRS